MTTSDQGKRQDKRYDKRLRRDVAWNLVPVAVLAIVGLGLNFAIAGWWSEAALGVFTLVTSAFFAFGVLGAAGIQYSVLRSVAEAPEDRDRVAPVVVGALVPTIVLSALVTGVFVALREPIAEWQHSDAVADGMLWAAPGLFCFSINKVLLNVVNGLRRMRAFAIYTLLRYSLLAVGLLVAHQQRIAIEQLPVLWTFTEGVLLLVLIGELLATVKLARAAGWSAWSRHHMGYGARGVLATLGYEVNSKLDVWMLGIALSNSQVGIYSLVASLYEGVLQLAVVVQSNVNPIIARDVSEGRFADVEALARRSWRWFVPAMLGICVVSALVYPAAIPWVLAKPAFVDGAVPFAILLGGIVLASPYLPFMQMLLMTGRPGWHTGLVIAGVAIAFIANSLLIPRFGMVGAALGMGIGLVGSALLLRGLVRLRVGLRL
jgi:O-antigen/teichoic acid export membrane protein